MRVIVFALLVQLCWGCCWNWPFFRRPKVPPVSPAAPRDPALETLEPFQYGQGYHNHVESGFQKVYAKYPAAELMQITMTPAGSHQSFHKIFLFTQIALTFKVSDQQLLFVSQGASIESFGQWPVVVPETLDQWPDQLNHLRKMHWPPKISPYNAAIRKAKESQVQTRAQRLASWQQVTLFKSELTPGVYGDDLPTYYHFVASHRSIRDVLVDSRTGAVSSESHSQ